MSKLILTIIISLTAFLNHQNTKSNPEKIQLQVVKDSLTNTLTNANKEGELVGFSVSIINQDTILYNEGFGYSDSKNNKKYQTNTIQNVGSISKTFIGISLLKAQELGKLNIHDPINKYLPFELVNPSYPDTPITLLQLATHSSSIIDYEENYLKGFILKNKEIKKDEVPFTHFQNPDKRIPLIDFLEACFSKDGKWYTPKSFSANKPGSTFKYTNFGANLCALIIAQATEMSFKEFTKTYIFEPLGMKDSAWALNEVDASRRSKFYLYKDQKIADYESITYPDGGLFTTSEDLSKYLSELMKGYDGKGTILNNTSYNAFFKKRFKDNINKSGRINVGTFIEYNNDFIGSTDLLIGHNGSDLGSLAMMYFNPETKIGKILMINTDIDYKEEVVVPHIKDVWKSIIKFENNLQ
ncbi:serine hydrolase domain-containing protein [Aquimarina sp. 2201CG5-10]|uniref:serine hydrolase domain-containing protein n=1 Tax=Aquimarina callyspongiae TaxID=3098150 RepID=UPI002AB51BA9|nr:serine hydrolase domain-containing protein [Aquimarina sp. 2201CG5-10]MDY8137953.1 serine hydrolase domain-containing protein [Aquimarina sp. 2201CG5-10]